MIILAKLNNILPPERILQNESMKKHTTFKIGGEADVIVLPQSREEILNCLKFAKDEGVPIHVFGNGSNLVVSDKGIRGISLKLFNGGGFFPFGVGICIGYSGHHRRSCIYECRSLWRRNA